MGVPFPAGAGDAGHRYRSVTAPRSEIPALIPVRTYLAIPALFPDVGIIHVHQADIYGNAQIEGINIVDLDLARASRRLILTTERIIDTDEFRRSPGQTSIPYWLVDAVCLVPYGSYPGEMPYEYTSDEQHFAEWIEAEQDPAELRGIPGEIYLRHARF